MSSRAVIVHAFSGLIAFALLMGLSLSCGKPRTSSLARWHTSSSNSLSSVLEELAEMSPPKGADPAVFQQLKNELAQLLQAKSTSKITSKPPTGDANKASGLALTAIGGGTLRLEWGYYNLGDYGQNGTVDISDISPIAMHFGETGTPGDATSLIGVIDGSGNGKVDIADITPLAQNFGTSVAYYGIEASFSSSGPFTQIGASGMNTAQGADRRVFSFDIAQPSHVYYRVVPFDSSDEPGVASETIRRAGLAPDITTVTPNEGVAGTQVQFAADVIGDSPLSYSWDFGGGATPNISSNTSPLVTLGDPGQYSAQLTVSSPFGNDSFPFSVEVSGAAPDIISITPSIGCEGRNVTFTAVVEGSTPITYSWDFGGAATPGTSTEPSPEVTLAAAGDYNVHLEITNDWGSDAIDTPLTITATDYVWNFAVYMGADNNLAEGIWADVQQLEHVGSSPEVAVNLQGEFWYEAGFQWPNIERVYVVQDFDDDNINNTGHPANMTFDRTGYDSASPQAISDYLNWSTQNFVASKNLLILSDHGAGWYNGHTVSGIITDDSEGSPFVAHILADHAIAKAMQDTGVHYDVLMFDACDMSALEVAYEYRNVADYAVCSECVLPVKGNYYEPALTQLEANPSMPPADVAQLLADELINYYTAHPEDIIDVSAISVLDLHAADSCITALNAFTDEVLNRFTTEQDAVTAALNGAVRNETQRVDGDIFDFLELYRAGTSSPEVQARIDDLLAALQNLVIFNDAVWATGDYSRYHGLTIWMPDQIGYSIFMADYRDPSFYDVTSWEALLDKIIGYHGTKVGGGLRFEITWDTDANVDLRVNEPDPWDTDGYRWNAPWEGYSYNGYFSGESNDTGENYEWWQSWDWVMPGNYTFAAEYYVDGDTADYANVHLKVWDDGVLVHDETVFMDYNTPWDPQYGGGWKRYNPIVR